MPLLDKKIIAAGAVTLAVFLATAVYTYYLGALSFEDSRPTREFNIIVKQFEFQPSVIRVKLGERVVVHLTSIDVPHGFGISEFGINVQILPNETTTVSFVADRQGTFTIFCTVFCGTGHPNHKGTLIVE